MRFVYLFLIISLTFMLACGGNGEDTEAAESAEEVGEDPLEPEKEYQSVTELGEWREITSEEGDFKFMSPGEPSFDVDTVSTPNGPVEYPSYSLAASDKYFFIGYSDMPEQLVSQAPAKVVLDGAVRGMISEARGTSISDTLMENEEFTAREHLVSLSDGQSLMRVRTYMSGNRIYIIAASAPETDTTGLLGRFVESFELVGREYRK